MAVFLSCIIYRMTIRRFRNRDAVAVSELIVENLKNVNIHDYSDELINALATYKTPQQVLDSAGKSDAFVAEENSVILGVVMLKGNEIINMFVHMQAQGKWVGQALMNCVENLAKTLYISELIVYSSITAVEFYKKCGYSLVKKVNKPFRDIENNVFRMTKTL